MERNSTESGKLMLGLGYNYEYLSKAMVGSDEWMNINNERTNFNGGGCDCIIHALSKNQENENL